jgi:hypothetical protein
MALADKYNNIVGNTNNAKITVRVDSSFNKNKSSLRYSPIVEGPS